MNILGLCVVLIGLSVEGYSKTIVDTPVTRGIDEKLEKDVDDESTKIIVDNSTVAIDDENDYGGLEDVFRNFFAPANELQGAEEGRTFGVKRIQFMMMPMIYKMGVMMTLLVVLTVISLKGLAIGVMLLILKLSTIFGKFYASAQSHGVAQGWAPQPPQPVHVHLHNGGAGHQHAQPYGGWDAASGPPEDQHYYYKG